ncbi:MAG: DUF3566 domain-containing protein [Actinomycetota bacterium]|nr:DUF3566 domain-containing protein [Actinomycetota bacterium]
MSDRRRDQGAPLFPRRTLSGPDPSQSGTGRERDDGPPTAALPRVDEQTHDRGRSGQPQGRSYAPSPASPGQPARPPAGRGQPSAQAREPHGATTLTAQGQPSQRGKSPRRARLRIVRLDPWSVMKMAFALSIALAVVTVVAVAIVWSVLDTAGVWESINTGVDTLTNPDAGDGFDVQKFVGLGRVMGLTMVISLANVVLLTALATLGAFIYNLAAALLGGFEVTLAEDR